MDINNGITIAIAATGATTITAVGTPALILAAGTAVGVAAIGLTAFGAYKGIRSLTGKKIPIGLEEEDDEILELESL